MPEDADAEHPVAGIDGGQAGVGSDLQYGVLAGFSVIGTLVKMVSAEVERVVYFDVLFSFIA